MAAREWVCTKGLKRKKLLRLGGHGVDNFSAAPISTVRHKCDVRDQNKYIKLLLLKTF